ncbi:MAG: hypothetical protein M0Q53_00810 [Prolixibacteraceae bacterium]|jgi:hypothetical protein|nr:hypothetical protein [Prolixibacteraceae bacterium]
MKLILTSLLLLFSLHLLSKDPIFLENKNYLITLSEKSSKDFAFKITHKASHISRVIKPSLQVLYSPMKPNLVESSVDKYPVIAWKYEQKRAESNFFRLPGSEYTATKVAKNRNSFDCHFNQNEYGKLFLKIELSENGDSPSIIMEIQAEREGWYSIGFTGLTAVDPAKLDFLYLPLTWSWKRFPSQVCMSEEAFSTTAATFLNFDGFTEGVAADPKMIPYRFALSVQWGKEANSLFGLAIRNAAGLAKPMIFAPLLGGLNSHLNSMQKYSFSSKYILIPGDWMAGSEYILKEVFKYKNERQNATLSLNQTLENMIDFGMNDKLSGWVDDLKGFDYGFDAPGTVKVVSALHALGIALTMGDYEVYKKRALPLIEYVMSREKYLYSIDETQKTQNPSHFLKGPCVEIGELAGLFEMTGGKTPAFKFEADRLFGKPRQLNLLTLTGGASWQDYLARYKMLDNQEDLMTAKKGASDYLSKFDYPKDFNTSTGLLDRQASFYTDFTSKVFDLFELWEVSNDKKFLDAAHTGARELILWSRSNPMAPDSLITVNSGGIVDGIFPGRRSKANSYEFDKRDMKTKIAEQKIPAWRTSLIGLTPEASSTYNYGPIMLAHHAPWFLRIAEATGDRQMADVAYNTIVGRYANFPGYYFTSLATNVYQHPDYPLHDYYDIKYNAIFYNHIWPHIALINDFLVSDAFYRSSGQIDFPSVYAPGYAFLSSKVYGHKPGRIFDNENIKLWLPKKAISTSNISFNYLFGAGKDALYLVLMNTTSKIENVEIQLNQDVITYSSGKTYSAIVYDEKGNKQNDKIKNGKIHAVLPAHGLSTIKIEDLIADIPFFESIDHQQQSYSNNNFIRNESENNMLGTITAMLINLTAESSDAYVFSNISDKTIKKACLKYRIGATDWQIVEDAQYPFEFTIHLSDPKQKFIFKWISEDQKGNITESAELSLSNL